ncbi:conserved hypothetical protein [Histoplasma capsulatum G186AR]|uniref:FAD dependent oxidoreductase domain-containing protein n=1 Tax=Ajellomyces capsulatus (strain G186AR / H82 / ATCC MYA-2454 / RMSCC 2432) TaxID=447093 RepID=C0NT88_AJECG|nr:uncharacterized protein HCBG_06368 [Histoplasma capsulatum G186AR]EEH05249.1 conserved hypothetical protein [Histoplasma capsulatum G186AR]
MELPRCLNTVFPSPSTTTSPETTVIIGAGVIGLSTAYYLAQALNETTSYMPPYEPDVVVIDSSHDICAGASGKATGGLGNFGFRPETSSLGSLSYKLHKELASKYNGREKYKFSDLSIYRVSSKNFAGNPSPPDSWSSSAPIDKNISDLPPWINPSNDWKVQLLADAPHAAHLDPEQFCRFLRHQCENLGVRFLLNSEVTSVQRDHARQSFTSITVQTRDTQAAHIVPCRAIVIAAGPWSTRVFSQLFPAGHLNLRMDTMNSAGNHVLLRNPRWEPAHDKNGVGQVFLNNVVNSSNNLDITAFLGGYLYIGGWGAKPECLPEFAEGVHSQPDEIEEMLKVSRQYFHLEDNEELEIVKPGRCYRPLAIPNIPTITKVSWEMLGNPKFGSEAHCSSFKFNNSPVIGGLYLNTGHNSDGVTLGPGSGKVMKNWKRDKFDNYEISRSNSLVSNVHISSVI